MLEIVNHITLHSKTTHDTITCTNSSIYDKRRGQPSKVSNIAYTLEAGHVFYPALTGSKTPTPQNSAKAKTLGEGSPAHKSPIGEG
ncbi:hypothetical protein [Bacillus mycoides]|uniref:hypothetical protein n=1 Tax=Bacillus mycoides TaxID=1405 RepID=UPI003D66293F